MVPVIDPAAYVHPDAVVIGAVELAAGASVWPTAVLRGDHGVIRIGERTSIQDGTIVHTTHNWPTVQTGAVVAAAALVREDMVVPPGALALGVPATIREGAGLRQRDWIARAVKSYVQTAN